MSVSVDVGSFGISYITMKVVSDPWKINNRGTPSSFSFQYWRQKDANALFRYTNNQFWAWKKTKKLYYTIKIVWEQRDLKEPVGVRSGFWTWSCPWDRRWLHHDSTYPIMLRQQKPLLFLCLLPQQNTSNGSICPSGIVNLYLEGLMPSRAK